MVKMLTPFLLLYSFYQANLSTQTILNVVKALILIISLIMIISNLFCFSYGNYSDTIIKTNFFDWFKINSEYDYKDLASKGLFEYGNQIGAILIMFLPFMIYSTFKKFGLVNFVTLTCHTFALILLCTRVSVLGIFIVFIYTLFILYFITLIRKNKFNLNSCLPVILLLICYGLLLPANPMFSRMNEHSTIIQTFNSENKEIPKNITPPVETQENDEVTSTDSFSNDNDNNHTAYIENTYKDKQIPEQFLLERYPYQYDNEFWYNFLQKDISLTTNNRYIELAIIQRVVEINNNPMDNLLGITNTRLQNIFNIEKDFIVQYYALGIIGLLLIFIPYFALIIIFMANTLKQKLKNLTMINLLAFTTIIFLLGISYMSGNLLNSLSFTIYFVICFYLLRR